MMETLFVSMLNISITANWVILAVIVMRLIFFKAPKRLICALWTPAALRLVMPFSLRWAFNLIPSTQTVDPDVSYSYASGGVINSGFARVDSAAGAVIDDVVSSSGIPLLSWTQILSLIWAAGLAAMLAYMLISRLMIGRMVRESAESEGNIRICDRISSPFLLGVFSPKIYLPTGLDPQDAVYVRAHETAHLRRRDNIVKPLAFLLLAVYWFDPLVWAAYFLLYRDIESACDEKAAAPLTMDERKEYCSALIAASTAHERMRACPLAFGANAVKARVKAVLNYKKPALWITATAAAACIVTAACLLTDPVSVNNSEIPKALDNAVSAALSSEAERYGSFSPSGCAVQGHATFGSETNNGVTRVYCYAEIGWFNTENGYFTEVSGSSMPVVLRFTLTDGNYTLVGIDYASDGADNGPSIKKLFPLRYRSRALDPTEKDRAAVDEMMVSAASAYLDSAGISLPVRLHAGPYDDPGAVFTTVTASY